MKTDVEMLRKDKSWYPKRVGVITGEEVRHIEEAFELNNRDEVSLRNLRNTVVLYNSLSEGKEPRVKDLDRVSAITSVIDRKLLEMGCEV